MTERSVAISGYLTRLQQSFVPRNDIKILNKYVKFKAVKN
ncbi:hypothetical protein Rsl_1411 [Rickettsia slovaca 13-B]|uniref:Uncharacterized protein n=1 Tax=Rickettsia slovaca (strain 13-B) TaxID=941638 RepID=A0ABN4A8N7_RICS1|nr:hypothetical protein Rsl_1411 [Rickettsia slovaca 13-B]